MPFIPVPDTVEVEVVYELYDQIVENTMYFTQEGSWTGPQIVDLLEQVRSHIESDLLPLLSSALKLVRLIGTLLDAVDAISIVSTVSPPSEGGQSSSGLPNNAAYVVTFNTAGRGRSNRGRNYIAGLCLVEEVDANTVTSAFRTGLLDFYTSMMTDLAGSGYQMVVVSRFSGVDSEGKPIPRTTGVTNAITSFSTFDNTLDSQRRRLPGRGR